MDGSERMEMRREMNEASRTGSEQGRIELTESGD